MARTAAAQEGLQASMAAQTRLNYKTPCLLLLPSTGTGCTGDAVPPSCTTFDRARLRNGAKQPGDAPRTRLYVSSNTAGPHKE